MVGSRKAQGSPSHNLRSVAIKLNYAQASSSLSSSLFNFNAWLGLKTNPAEKLKTLRNLGEFYFHCNVLTCYRKYSGTCFKHIHTDLLFGPGSP